MIREAWDACYYCGGALSPQHICAASQHAARRDRFAAAALTGCIATGEYTLIDDAAMDAVRYADALIAALDKETGE